MEGVCIEIIEVSDTNIISALSLIHISSSVGLPELKTGKTAEKPQSKAEEKAEYKAFLRRKVFLNPTRCV